MKNIVLAAVGAALLAAIIVAMHHMDLTLMIKGLHGA